MKTMNSFRFAIIPKILVITGSVLFGNASHSTNCFARNVPVHTGAVMQGGSQPSDTVALDQLSGYYQLPGKVTFIEFQLKDNVLFAKQLWDNKEYQLIRINETSFETKEEGHKIEFMKDSSGQFNNAKILGRIMITKVDFDPGKIIALSADRLKQLEGIYMSRDNNDLRINIQSTATGLTVKQMWDNKNILFAPRSATFFLNDDDTFPLTFIQNHGLVTQVICFESDVWIKVK